MIRKSKILIFGADGMLGYQLWKCLNNDKNNEVIGTVRKTKLQYGHFPNSFTNSLIFDLDILNDARVESLINEFRPDFIVNTVGIVKQRIDSIAVVPSITINALFPHKLSKYCEAINCKLVLVSTDCVFSGEQGHYKEIDVADCADVYGRTKWLGEITDKDHVITLRTSIIGYEVFNKKSLLEWFLAQENNVTGYSKAIFSGLTTNEFSRVISRVVRSENFQSGLWHVSAEPISKYALLMKIKNSFELKINLIENYSVVIDRSLDSTAFRNQFSYTPLSWDNMVDELKEMILGDEYNAK